MWNHRSASGRRFAPFADSKLRASTANTANIGLRLAPQRQVFPDPILVVDDEEYVRISLAALLEKEGCEAIVADEGAAFVGFRQWRFRRSRHRCRIGHDFWNVTAASDTHCKIPVSVLTCGSNCGFLMKSAGAQVDWVVAKPSKLLRSWSWRRSFARGNWRNANGSPVQHVRNCTDGELCCRVISGHCLECVTRHLLG